VDLSRVLDHTSDAVIAVARQEILPRYLSVARHHKADGSIYTEADLKAQAFLVEMLHKILPVPILGEEMSQAKQKQLWDQHAKSGLWCVDPIDGTTNFVNGMPFFAVSVALFVDEHPALGVLYDPIDEELFSASLTNAATLNGEPLPLKDVRLLSIKQALAGIDFHGLPKPLATALIQQHPFGYFRSMCASTLEWCYTAAGRFDLYLHGGQMLWDYSAGAFIYERVGGKMATLEKDDYWQDDIWHRSAIAALNPILFEEWEQWIRQHLHHHLE
jgi:myo-inositol-1(or 4)-monophosphatase